MTKDEALRLALEALSEAHYVVEHRQDVKKREQAITAVKEALAQPEQDGECKYCTDGCLACDARKLPEQEPVAWFSTLPDGRLSIKIVGKPTEGNWEPLYTAPPQRTWVGLTEDEQTRLFTDWDEDEGWGPFIEAIEAKLKEKNT